RGALADGGVGEQDKNPTRLRPPAGKGFFALFRARGSGASAPVGRQPGTCRVACPGASARRSWQVLALTRRIKRKRFPAMLPRVNQNTRRRRRVALAARLAAAAAPLALASAFLGAGCVRGGA